MIGNLKNSLCFITTSIFFCFQVLKAQVPIHAIVSDASLNTPLENVEIRIQNSSYVYTSDTNGYFYLKINTEENTQDFNGYFLIEQNTLHSFFNSSYNISICNSVGKTVYKENHVVERTSIPLNSLKTGNYFIRIYSLKGTYTYRLITSRNNNYISNPIKRSIESVQKSDSINFSKEGYFDRKLAMTDYRLYNTTGVKLLKKSYKNLNFFNELVDRNAFEMIANQPTKTHLSGIESVKVIFDQRKDEIYYMNSKKYFLHYNFAKENMGYSYSQNQFSSEQYRNNSNRYLYPFTINYFKELDIYTFEFFASDDATCEAIYKTYHKILQSSFLRDKLYFYNTNNLRDPCSDIPAIGPNELYEGQNYQALNLAEGYGYLRKIEINDIPFTEFERHDIVLTNGIPFDIPVIAGIITTEYQTPLSHINVLSHSRGTPNMTLKNGFENKVFNKLNGELVYLEVAADSYKIRKCTLEEAESFWKKNEPKEIKTLDKDTKNYGLVVLENATIEDVNKIGGKAANFAEILKAFKREDKTAPVPENYFAIPFYYYDQHLKKHGIDTYIEAIINQSEFKTNSVFRKSMLNNIRDTIINSSLDEELLTKVVNKMVSDDRFTSYRFRSSTNAEDLEGFNGAGIYSSYSGKLDHNTKTPSRAIKSVWASLWNHIAYEERDYFKINHLSTAMGILVHRSFPDEDANGVVITRNIFNRNHAFVVNVQFKEISVVDAEPGVIHDQVIIYTFSSNGKRYTLEYTTFSNVITDTSGHVMTNEELYELGDYLSIINIYFYNRVYDCKCDYPDFGLDIEFKVDSSIEDRKIYIKQARPY